MMDGVETRNDGRAYRRRQIEDLEAEYKVPIEWADGPIRDRFRKVTNKCCLLLFILCMLAMISTAAYAFLNSEADAISRVYDSSGNNCGDNNAKDFPYLYLMTFKAPYKSVCVSKCPTFDYNEIKYNASGHHPLAAETPGAEPLDFKTFSKNYAGLSKVHSPKITPKEAFGYDKGWANNYFTEDQFNTYTRRFKIDCLPNKEFHNCEVDNENFYAYDSYGILNLVCVPLTPKAALMFNKVSKKFNTGVAGDIKEAMGLFGWGALIALGASLAFIILIYCCTTLIAWVLLLTLALTFIAAGALVIFNYTYTGPLNNAFNAARVKFLQFLVENKTLMLTLSVISILLGLFTFFVMCKFRKYVRTAIPMLSYAASTTLKNGMLILLSAFTLALQIAVFFAEIYIVLRIYTTGREIHENKQGSPFVAFEMDEYKYAMLALHAFGAYWLLITLNNFNDFVTAAITCNIYFRQHTVIKNLNIFCHCLGHHIGSIAWSIILLPVLIFKLALGWLDYLTTSDNPNCLQRLFRKLFCLCCWCYENFIDRFSESYFPIVYMGSENFYPANTRFYYLKEKYSDEAYMISIIGELFGVVGKILIAFLTTYCSYVIYNNSMELGQNIEHVGTMFVLTFIIGFFIGSLFVNLFATTYDTIMVCYLIERNIQEHYGTAQLKCPEEVAVIMREIQAENDRKYKRLV